MRSSYARRRSWFTGGGNLPERPDAYALFWVIQREQRVVAMEVAPVLPTYLCARLQPFRRNLTPRQSAMASEFPNAYAGSAGLPCVPMPEMSFTR